MLENLITLRFFFLLLTGSPIMLGANPLPSDTLASSNSTEDAFNTSLPAEAALPLLLDAPIATNDSNTTAGTPETFVCAFYNPDFIIYSSLGSFYIPCIIMVYLYIRIFSVCKWFCFYYEQSTGF